MKIVSDMSGDYADGVTANLKLEYLSEDNSEEVLFCGYNSIMNSDLQEKYSSYKRKVLLNLWTPTDFLLIGDDRGRNAIEQPSFFDEIYTICPYTIDWHHRHHGDNRYKYIFHPFDGSHVPVDYEKDADVCYFGGIHGNDHLEMIEGMRGFNYRVISMLNNRFVTHHNIPHHEKLNVVAKTKISLCVNLLPLEPKHVLYLTNYDAWDKNVAFRSCEQGLIPQYKCRAAEAAFCKSLLLVKRDPWNLIEHYFVPDEEFIYYSDTQDLKEKIFYIINNYDQFQVMIEKAYKRSLNYTSKPLVDIIKSKKEWRPLNV
jgi:hypothetical protein